MTDLVKAFTGANIPLEKVNCESLRKFFNKHVRNGGAIPKANTLRSEYVGKVYEEHMADIKELIGDRPVAICVDETTDVKQRYVLNILAKPLNASTNEDFFLIDTVFLEKCDNSTVSQAVIKSLTDFGIDFDQVRAFISDSAGYMIKAFRDVLSKLFTRAEHVTCWAHILHLVGEAFRNSFSEVDDMVSLMKKLLSKSPARKIRYLQYLEESHVKKPSLCPEPVVTRWGTWLNACVYHSKHIELYQEFVLRELKICTTKVLVSLRKLFEESLTALKEDLEFIALHAPRFMQTLFTLEKSELLLSDTYDIASDFLTFLKSDVGVNEEKHRNALSSAATKLSLYIQEKHPALPFLRAARVTL